MTRKPLIDPVLGRFSWQVWSESWEGSVRLSTEQLVKLSIISDHQDVLSLLAKARVLIPQVLEREKLLRGRVVESVMHDYCEKWQLGPVDREAIAGNLSLCAINLWADGDVHLYYVVGQDLSWWQEGGITLMLDPGGDVRDVAW